VWVASLGGLGCGGGDGVPLGGPFGGTVPAYVMDAGTLGDGDGVLPLTNNSNVQSASGDPKKAPTWTQLFNAYLAAGTVGNCAHSGCHRNVMGSPSAAFSWLHAEQQLNGPEPAIADSSSSCLSWLGGDMPPGGPATDPVVELDLESWVKAGAKNN
jgi:hypothetical protein